MNYDYIFSVNFILQKICSKIIYFFVQALVKFLTIA